MLFALGSWMARRTPGATVAPAPAPPAPPWTREVAPSDEPLTVAQRFEVIERLALVGAPWCIRALEDAVDRESEPELRDAAERALLVIACRPDLS